MKNQYFGDINDYKKYGLLRILTNNGKIPTCICWMLTPNDGKSDGKLVQYLDRPEKWRHFDPSLYDLLRHTVDQQKIRDVKYAKTVGIIPNAKYFDRILSDNLEERKSYFNYVWKCAEGSDLVFFDPDNGIEVNSKRKGNKDSSKYLYWDELKAAYHKGYSVLVYQHFPRIKRDVFIKTIESEAKRRINLHNIYHFRFSNVVFFLLIQKSHFNFLTANIGSISQMPF